MRVEHDLSVSRFCRVVGLPARTYRHDGLAVSDATCLRVLRDAGLVLPVDYVRERRDLAKARREAFVTIPTRRNRVWQTDFFELETSGGGTWRSGDVIDYATKLVLAGPVTATQTARDAISAIEDARAEVHDLLGRSLLDDITCSATEQITPVIVVSDNGPCYKSSGFARYIASRPSSRTCAPGDAHRRPTASSSATTARSRSSTSGASCPPTAPR